MNKPVNEWGPSTNIGASSGADRDAHSRSAPLSIEEVLGLEQYKGVPVREVNSLDETYHAFRALGEAEQQHMNRRAKAALELINRRRLAMEAEQPFDADTFADLAAYDALRAEQQRHIVNCTPGRSDLLIRTVGQARRDARQWMFMGGVLGASVGAFAMALVHFVWS